MIDIAQKPLSGKRGLVLGIANEHSIAYGCAQAFRAFGAELAITYSSDKAKPYVEPLARELEAPIFLPCDVRGLGELDAVFQAIGQAWSELDFALHAIAYAPKEDLQGRARGLLARWIPPGNGRLVPLVYTHGSHGGAADAKGGRPFHDELLRRREGHRALQRDGPRQGRVGKRRTLSRL